MRYKNVKIKRKCGCCKEDFYISNENIDEAIYYDKKTYHSSCFINICNKRSEMKRANVSQKWTQILNQLDSIKQESYDHLKLAITKEEVYDFIRDTYDITIVPKSVWEKLGNIYNGSFRGMSHGITPGHLLDMWERKIHMLNGLASKNEVQGKKMNTEQRINYDLSVLVNKYDSYLKWLEKQKILEAENRQNLEKKNTNTIVSIMNVKSNEENSQNNDDMSELVDDIFED